MGRRYRRPRKFHSWRVMAGIMPRYPESSVLDELDLPQDGAAESVEVREDEWGREEVTPVSLPVDVSWSESPPGDGKTGTELIAHFVKRIPNDPGVYRMFDAKGEVLYVGKARNLKKRVSSYTRTQGHTRRIARMIRETANMEFVVTRSETEALLLEANLIKRLRPRFNVLMRDDKSFPYIVVTKHEAPAIFKHRGARSRDADYFGPFASAGAVTRTINSLQRAFMLRSCTDSVYAARTRPCLLYQIKRCAAPCTGEIEPEEYEKLVKDAKGFLSGRSKRVKDELSAAMQQASSELDFERAARYRDRLTALSSVQSHQGINPETVDNADVFALHQDGGQTCVQVFFFRAGQNWGNRAFFPRADASVEPEDVLGAFITQFYDDKPVPPLVLLDRKIEEMDLLGEALSGRAGLKVKLTVPQRGEKKELVDQAARNAREALARRLSETSSQARLLDGLKDTLSLEHTPRRIEVYDNSHIMGTNAVGVMVVAGRTGFAKSQYRKFNIKNEELTPGDDFGMMREVMERRFKRLVKEHPDGPLPHDADVDPEEIPAWPDLLLIDGGLGQLNAVLAILKELGIEDKVLAVGIAKGVDRDAGRERIFIPGRNPFTLPPRDPVLYFIQRLRDEAHRFAIGTHRAKRKKEMVSNPLDEIAGIGPTRKRALLSHFGTAKGVSRAGLDDLREVDGISEAMAQQIFDHFHERVA